MNEQGTMELTCLPLKRCHERGSLVLLGGIRLQERQGKTPREDPHGYVWPSQHGRVPSWRWWRIKPHEDLSPVCHHDGDNGCWLLNLTVGHQ